MKIKLLLTILTLSSLSANEYIGNLAIDLKIKSTGVLPRKCLIPNKETPPKLIKGSCDKNKTFLSGNYIHRDNILIGYSGKLIFIIKGKNKCLVESKSYFKIKNSKKGNCGIFMEKNQILFFVKKNKYLPLYIDKKNKLVTIEKEGSIKIEFLNLIKIPTPMINYNIFPTNKKRQYKFKINLFNPTKGLLFFMNMGKIKKKIPQIQIFTFKTSRFDPKKNIYFYFQKGEEKSVKVLVKSDQLNQSSSNLESEKSGTSNSLYEDENIFFNNMSSGRNNEFLERAKGVRYFVEEIQKGLKGSEVSIEESKVNIDSILRNSLANNRRTDELNDDLNVESLSTNQTTEKTIETINSTMDITSAYVNTTYTTIPQITQRLYNKGSILSQMKKDDPYGKMKADLYQQLYRDLKLHFEKYYKSIIKAKKESNKINPQIMKNIEKTQHSIHTATITISHSNNNAQQKCPSVMVLENGYCKICNPNEFIKKNACVQCPQNMLSNEMKNKCICQSGYEMIGILCLPCEEGRISKKGSECKVCSEGSIPNKDKNECIVKNVNSFKIIIIILSSSLLLIFVFFIVFFACGCCKKNKTKKKKKENLSSFIESD